MQRSRLRSTQEMATTRCCSMRQEVRAGALAAQREHGLGDLRILEPLEVVEAPPEVDVRHGLDVEHQGVHAGLHQHARTGHATRARLVGQRHVPLADAEHCGARHSPRSENTTSGLPQAFCTTPTSRIHMPCAKPVPMRLDDRFLGGKAHGEKALRPLRELQLRPLRGSSRCSMKREPKRSSVACDALGLEHVHADAKDHARAASISAFISRTARARPTNSARAMMAWPMLSSTISGSAATGCTF